jgi:quinohemoprotein ethanol dehydrogenase
VKAAGELVAWDPVSQTERWRVQRRVAYNGGVLATAGGLVFQGTADGHFEAFAASTGRKLWSFPVDGEIMAAPTTVNVDGQQIILVASGDGGSAAVTHTIGLYGSPQSEGPARLLAFKLGGTGSLEPSPDHSGHKLPEPFRTRQPPELAEKGKALFEENCSICHGINAINAGHGIPDLRASSRETFEQMRVILDGAYIPAGMPSFKHIDNAQLAEIQAYITNQAWAGYEAQNSGLAPLK